MYIVRHATTYRDTHTLGEKQHGKITLAHYQKILDEYFPNFSEALSAENTNVVKFVLEATYIGLKKFFI